MSSSTEGSTHLQAWAQSLEGSLTGMPWPLSKWLWRSQPRSLDQVYRNRYEFLPCGPEQASINQKATGESILCLMLTPNIGIHSLIICYINDQVDRNIMFKKKTSLKSDSHFYAICITSTAFCKVDNWPVFLTHLLSKKRVIIIWLNIIFIWAQTFKMRGNPVFYILLCLVNANSNSCKIT